MDLTGVKVIGLGGIGSLLAGPLLRYLSYTHQATDPVEILLIDGDMYEAKNMERQVCNFDDLDENKAQATANRLIGEFPALDITAMGHYVTPENVGDFVKEGDVVLMCVDNHKTRKQVSDYACTLQNVTLISGGNEWTDGNIQVYIKRNGEELTAPITHLHPEIENPPDKSPAEKGCADLMESAPQLHFMNLAIASLMASAFLRIVNEEDMDDMYGEVYIDITKNNARAANRKPPAATKEGGAR